MAKKNIAQLINDVQVVFSPKNIEQENMIKTIDANLITFVTGPAGTGKSHVAIAYALQGLFQEKCSRIILTRPIVQAGENLGWLPGVLDSKVKDYFVPMYIIMSGIINPEILEIVTKNNGIDAKIQILPLGFMRGHTFSNTIVIADECQNTSPEQMRLLLTRVGDNCKIIVCGDETQSDIRSTNGLKDAIVRFTDIATQNQGIGIVKMSEESIVRHPIIKLIEEIYRRK